MAQISTVLTMQSNPPASLSEWAIKNATINFIVTKTDSGTTQALVRTVLKLTDGTVVGSIDLNRISPVQISKGTRVFFSKDILPLEAMVFTGKYKTSMDRTGKLPSDQYQLTVELLNPATVQPLCLRSQKHFCSSHSITHVDDARES